MDINSKIIDPNDESEGSDENQNKKDEDEATTIKRQAKNISKLLG